jgi:uncharacterized membrane protein
MTFNFSLIQIGIIIVSWFLSLGIVVAIMLDSLLLRLHKRPLGLMLFCACIMFWWAVIFSELLRERKQ